MKKALIIATTGGFINQFEERNARMLQQLGYKVSYAANYTYNTYGVTEVPSEIDGIRVHQIPVTREPWHVVNNVRAISWLRKYIREEGIDLVLCNNPMGGAAGRLAGGFFKKGERPYILYTAHGFHFYEGAPKKNWMLFYSAERMLARLTDHLLTINSEDYEAAKRMPLRGMGMVDIVPGVGLDMERFRPRPELRSEVRAELGVPEDAFHIVSASELATNKKLDLVIRAIGSIERDDVYLTICGEGDEHQALQELIRDMRLEGRVKLLGYRYDMERVLQSADCFAAVSLREGMGMAALEALACGVPLIASDNRGTREYARDGYNSIVCTANSETSIRSALLRLLRDPQLLQSLAENARFTAEPFRIEKADAQMQRILVYADELIRERKFDE